MDVAFNFGKSAFSVLQKRWPGKGEVRGHIQLINRQEVIIYFFLSEEKGGQFPELQRIMEKILELEGYLSLATNIKSGLTTEEEGYFSCWLPKRVAYPVSSFSI